nr:actin-related protein 2/3 complex subunit 1A-like [Tanacetum cinerariifolium]
MHEMVVGECHEPNSEGSGSAWKEYVNARVAGLFLLGVGAAPLMSPRQDETSEPLLYARWMAGPYRCKDATRGRNDDPVTRFVRPLENSGDFSVKSIRKRIDDTRFIGGEIGTRWIKSVPIKVNIMAWKIQSDALPTRFNISCRVNQFADCITCHAWSPDHSMIALCPNNNEVHIYKEVDENWERIHVLQKHDQIIAGIDWSKSSNRIVTVSHDRNSYVWNQEGSVWVPTLVILRLNRAALCVQWSPKGNKFAVGSGAKTVCICYYEQENNWFSLLQHLLMENAEYSQLLLKALMQGKFTESSLVSSFLTFHTFTKTVALISMTMIDSKPKKSGSGSSLDAKFGEQIVQLDLSFCWAFGVKWSPSGNSLSYVGHNSMIYFVDQIGPSPYAQTVVLRDLPLRDVMFVSEKLVIGVGYDCNPMVFAADGTGLWSFVRYLDEKKAESSGGRYGSQFTEAFGKFYGSSKQGTSNDKGRGGVHDNCINCIVPLNKPDSTKMTTFSTSGLDGKVVVWDLKNQEDLIEYL